MANREQRKNREKKKPKADKKKDAKPAPTFASAAPKGRDGQPQPKK